MSEFALNGDSLEHVPALPYQQELDMVVNQVLELHPEGHTIDISVLAISALSSQRFSEAQFQTLMNRVSTHKSIKKLPESLFRIGPTEISVSPEEGPVDNEEDELPLHDDPLSVEDMIRQLSTPKGRARHGRTRRIHY